MMVQLSKYCTSASASAVASCYLYRSNRKLVVSTYLRKDKDTSKNITTRGGKTMRVANTWRTPLSPEVFYI